MRPEDSGAVDLLTNGELAVHGTLVDASNATLLCAVSWAGVTARCVYKPIRGERPLWDFPDGTLAGREVATYLVAQAAGVTVIPPTVFRDGPYGPGMVQLWVDADPTIELVELVSPADVQRGWRHVFSGHDRFGEPVVLVHANHPQLRMLAALDAVVNNADRKGGHILCTSDGAVYGIDHGICLNSEDKLRTVLWGWVGEDFGADTLAALQQLRLRLDGTLAEQLCRYLTKAEVVALMDRVDKLVAAGVFPGPMGDWPPIPWPIF